MSTPDIPKGDVLIHAGDLTFRGQLSEIVKNLNWLIKHKENFSQIIVIPGNHDLTFESDFFRYKEEFETAGITLLNDSGVCIDGINFWGSPITPFFNNWAFNRSRGEDIKNHWDLIPDTTDVIISHGPPLGILDTVLHGTNIIGYGEYYEPIYSKGKENVGCSDLLAAVTRIKPSLHVFGHIHEGYGTMTKNETLFVNASIMNEKYKPINKPVVVDLNKKIVCNIADV